MTTKSLDEFSDESDFDKPCEKSESRIVSTKYELNCPEKPIIKDFFVKLEENYAKQMEHGVLR